MYFGIKFCLPALFLALTLPLVAQQEENLTTRPDTADNSPVEVRVRVMLIDLNAISGATQTFTANVGYVARWQDPRLAHDDDGPKTISLEEIWHPRLQIINQQRVQETFPEEALVHPDGEVVYTQRVWGNFSQPLILNDFPFDSQEIAFDMVTPGVSLSEMVFVQDPDHPSLAGWNLSIPDWTVGESSSKSATVKLAGGEVEVPVFSFRVKVQRNYGYYLVKVIIPLVMIIFMSWVVFWINPANSGPRISVSVTAMLTLVAYRFAVGASLPKISYLTKMDWFILGSSALVFIALLEVIVTSRMADNEYGDAARKLNRRMRIVAPIAFVAVAAFSLIA